MQPSPPTYSHSALEDFEKCPLKYRFKYIDRTWTGIETIETFMGKRVHEALRELYEDLWHSRRNFRPRLEGLLEFYSESWNKEWPEKSVRIVRGTANDYFEDGIWYIENYFHLHYPFDESRTIELEEVVEFDIDLGRCGERLFRGKVDRLALRADGVYEINDYKTGKLSRSKPMEDWSQLSLYQWAVQSINPEAHPIELVLHYLGHEETFCSRQTESKLADILRDTKRLIIHIESLSEFSPRPSPLCDWCEFRKMCPAWP